jgi:cell cycle arrest protein BUB3
MLDHWPCRRVALVLLDLPLRFDPMSGLSTEPNSSNPADHDNDASSQASLRRLLKEDGQPTDGITHLKYVSDTLLASASWDGCVRVHDTLRDQLVAILSFHSPVLSLATLLTASAGSNPGGGNGDSDDDTIYFFAGTLDGTVYRLDLEMNDDSSTSAKGSLKATVVGRHGASSVATEGSPPPAVSCLAALRTTVAVRLSPPEGDDRATAEPEEGEEDENVEMRTVCYVAAAGWDRHFTLWDGGQGTWRDDESTESSKTPRRLPLCEIPLPGKAFAMDSCRVVGAASAGEPSAVLFRCVVGTSGRRICVVDAPLPTFINSTSDTNNDNNDDDPTAIPLILPNVRAQLVLDRESSLKYQTRTVKLFPDASGIAVSSIEGRVAIEYLPELEVAPHPDSGGGKKYAFKCHRQHDMVYPVNCVEFHNDYPCVFATGGADGTVVLWDGFAKRKLSALGPDYPSSISALAFHPHGTEIAVAASCTYEKGGGGGENDAELQNSKNEIYIRTLLPAEFQHKK